MIFFPIEEVQIAARLEVMAFMVCVKTDGHRSGGRARFRPTCGKFQAEAVIVAESVARKAGSAG
jgi:hypothetical protein